MSESEHLRNTHGAFYIFRSHLLGAILGFKGLLGRSLTLVSVAHI